MLDSIDTSAKYINSINNQNDVNSYNDNDDNNKGLKDENSVKINLNDHSFSRNNLLNNSKDKYSDFKNSSYKIRYARNLDDIQEIHTSNKKTNPLVD